MFDIRDADPKDAPVILAMIKELAEFEREPDKVACTVEDIVRDGFSENPYFHCLVAETKAGAVGFALYYFKWSTWTGSPCLHLEDLYVKPEYRGRRIGFSLLKALAEIAVDRNCDRFEWDVLDWNWTARSFYHDLGAAAKDGWLTYRLDGKALSLLGEGVDS